MIGEHVWGSLRMYAMMQEIAAFAGNFCGGMSGHRAAERSCVRLRISLRLWESAGLRRPFFMGGNDTHGGPDRKFDRTQPQQLSTSQGGNINMANQMIRIRLKAYDHQLIDASAAKIVETAKAQRRFRLRSHSSAHQERGGDHPAGCP